MLTYTVGCLICTKGSSSLGATLAARLALGCTHYFTILSIIQLIIVINTAFTPLCIYSYVKHANDIHGIIINR